jgi:hypothetical protein
MNNFRLLVSFSVAILVSFATLAQKTPSRNLVPTEDYCTDYHRNACKFIKKDLQFKYNSQSKSALFRPGQSSTFTVVAFKGLDYRFAIAAEDVILNGQPFTYKVKDAKTNAVIFDSETEETPSDFSFTCDNSLNLRIELQLPEASAEDSKKMIYGCVGFLLESRKTLKTGF